MFGHNKRLEAKLREEGGLEAWATVIASETQWSSAGGANKVPGQAGSFTIHQKLKLRVEPDQDEPFEVTVKQVFNDTHGQHVPEEGWSVAVIYDRADHSKVVIDMDKMFVGPGVDRDAAVARHERTLTMVGDPDARAKRVEGMKAKAMANAGVSPELLAAQQALAAKFLQEQVSGAPSAPTPTVADELTKLAALRDRGMLTEAEFQQQKTKLLGSA